MNGATPPPPAPPTGPVPPTVQPPTSQPPTSPTPAGTGMGPSMNQPMPTGSMGQPVGAPIQEPPKRSSWLTMLIVAIVVLGLGYGVYYYFTNYASKNTTTTTVTPAATSGAVSTPATTPTSATTSGATTAIQTAYASATDVTPASDKSKAVSDVLLPALKTVFTDEVKLKEDSSGILTYIANREITAADVTALSTNLQTQGYKALDSSEKQLTMSKGASTWVITFTVGSTEKATIDVTY